MNRKRNPLRIAALLAGILFLAPVSALSQGVPLMTPDQLKARLDDGKTVVIDVRRQGDYEAGKSKIKGAVREAWDKPSQWAAKYNPDQTIVLYCAWNNEYTSARVALKLMKSGYKNVYALKGGWVAWEAAGYPVEPK